MTGLKMLVIDTTDWISTQLIGEARVHKHSRGWPTSYSYSVCKDISYLLRKW